MSVGQPYRNDLDTRNRAKVEAFTLVVGQAGVEKQIGFAAYGLVIDNLTNQWLFCREAFAFIAPYVSGRQIPVNGTQKITLAFQPPVGFTQQTSVAGQQVICYATAATVPPAPGITIAPGTSRWVITHNPAIAVQASVTKAAVAGVIHVTDAYLWSDYNNAAVSFERQFVIRDGASGVGGVLIQADLGGQNVAGSGIVQGLSGLAIKGTVGNAMTIESTAGDASTFQAVTLVGSDA